MAMIGRLLGAALLVVGCASTSHASCALVGDSIAHAAAMFAPHCIRATWPGLNSTRWLDRFGAVPIEADQVVISMGSNEQQNPALQGLLALRSKIRAARVMWIAPGPQYPSRNSVLVVAGQYGDVVYERPLEDLARDGIHFNKTGSQRIALLLQ
jgi:hypothetical protein